MTTFSPQVTQGSIAEGGRKNTIIVRVGKMKRTLKKCGMNM